jgi:prepilin-type N-terminal cleavage/methylation domain-containing protein
MRRAFTLIELLIVIAIIAILAVVVVLTLNPGQLILQARDSTRVSDLASLQDAIGLYITDAAVNGTVSLGSANTVYVSIPDPTATSTAGDQCQGLGLLSLPTGYAYHCAASSTFRMNDSTGWIPINFKSMSQGGVLGQLPQDPVNSSSSRTYETYTTDGIHYEVTAALESQKYKLGGSNDVVGTDGGTLATVYEKGTKLGLEPLDYGDSSLVGLWTFDEGTGTTINDSSGKTNNGTIIVNNSTYTWTTGKVGNAINWQPTCSLNCGSINSYVNINFAPSYSFSAGTYALWINPSVSAASEGYIFRGSGSPATLGFGMDGVWEAWFSQDYSNPVNCNFSPAVGSWTYLAVSYNGTTISCYQNGILTASVNPSNTTPSSITNMHIATRNDAYTAYWYGSLDDIRIYNRALSAAEIQAMYNGGK